MLRGARWPGDISVLDGVIEAVGVVPELPGDVVYGLTGTSSRRVWSTPITTSTSGLPVAAPLTATSLAWLTTLYPVWARLTPSDVGAAATVGLAELALSGCSTVADHHYLVPNGDDSVFDQLALAASTVGVRLHLARGSMDLGASAGGLPPDNVVEDLDAILTSTESVASRLHDGSRIVVTVAPCSPFSVTPQLMTESAAMARRLGLRLHTHLAETVEEEHDVVARFGMRPVDLMEQLGWVADDVWVAHGIHFNDAEVTRLGAAGVGVAHCPSSNNRLAAGHCRVLDLEAAGANVGLGVDGAASNEVGGLFAELRQSLYTARQRSGRPADFGPLDALRLGTVGGAKALGRNDIGVLEPGYRADLAVWPGEDIADIPDALTGLVLGPDRKVRHLFVDGEPVVTDFQLLGIDLAAARRSLAAVSRRLDG